MFLASAASTGVAAMILLVRWRLRDTPHEVLERLERVDAFAMVLELAMLAAFAASLGEFAGAGVPPLAGGAGAGVRPAGWA